MAYLNTTFAPSILDRVRTVAGNLKQRYQQHRQFRITLNELSSLSDRELSDLGLSRSELTRIAMECAYK